MLFGLKMTHFLSCFGQKLVETFRSCGSTLAVLLLSWICLLTLQVYPSFWNCLAELPTHQNTPELPCIVEVPLSINRSCSVAAILDFW